MIRQTLFLSIFLSLFFTGCFSISSLNPFSSSKEEKKEIEIPSDAPSWLQKRNIKNHIEALGLTKNIDKKELQFHTKKALIGASHNLTKKIYAKTLYLYKAYLEKLDNPHVFDKDIKKFAEHISLKSLTHSKIINSWISSDNELFIQLGVDSNIVAEQIQQSSKLLFDVDKKLYQNFLSNRSKKDIIKYLEE